MVATHTSRGDRLSRTRILVAEDDPLQAEMLRRYLCAAGHEVSTTHDGVSAVRLARDDAPDLVVLDVMMPGLDGLEVCRILRAESDVPILMLTARSAEDDLLAGLDGGADDYLRKPYSPREFVARVRALLRSRGATTTGERSHDVRRVGRLVVDRDRHRVTIDGAALDCTPAEFAILDAMAGRPGHVFSRAQLLTHTRGLDRSSTERSVDVHVMNLRRKMALDPPAVGTVYGVGYRLTPP